MQPIRLPARLKPHLVALLPGLIAVALFVLWAVHDGGYDEDTWYWGALLSLAVLTVTVLSMGARLAQLPRAAKWALALFALYVAWSYLSITWAASPGDALNGSNRALLYLVVFALLLILPWTPKGALIALLTFTIGIGVTGIVLMFRLASGTRVGALVIEGRLSAPTGYFNATAALFTIGAILAIGLACQRRLPGPLRGLLFAFACSGLQLALIVQSRGWLFTLPLIVVVVIVVAPSRLRFTAAAIIPAVGALVPLHRLLNVYEAGQGAALTHAAEKAGQAALLICAGVFVVGTLLAWGDSLWSPAPLSPRRRRMIGSGLIALAAAGFVAAGVAGTHGHPIRFVVRQWNGFSHVEVHYSTTSHFGDVGSGRYDFWRVSLDAFLAHPIGGLGQDNFADYYVRRRHTPEEPSWTHSFEMRLLAHTGAVGFVLFVGFLVSACRAAYFARRRGSPLVRDVAAVAVFPLIVWLIHGSIDWFWEMPALSGPALGFLAMAGSLSRTVVPAPKAAAPGSESAETDQRSRMPAMPRPVSVGAGLLALVAAVVALGFPYLSVREVSMASDISSNNPAQALSDLKRAADLNPLSAEPARLAGAIAMEAGDYSTAQERFRQAIKREPGGWFSWLGAGLAAQALKQTPVALRDFRTAYSINNRQPAVKAALHDLGSSHPLTYSEMLKLLILAP